MRAAAADLDFEESARLRDEIKRLRQTELAVVDDPTAKRPALPSPGGGGSARAARRGGGSLQGPHKPGLDETGIAITHEVTPSRPSPRSTLGKPGMRGGFKPPRRR